MIATIIAFITSHLAVFSAFGIALLDLLFALIPSWTSNGVLHWIYIQLGGKPPAA